MPHGWKWVELGKLAIDSADGPFGSNLKKDHYTTNKEVRIIQLSNIGEDGWKDENTKYTTFEHLAAISRSEVKSGDIVIAKMMPAGRAILCPDSDLKYVLSSDAVKFVLPEGICNKYVLNAINSAVFREQVYDNVQGVTRVRTSLQKLRTYLLPIPPLAEQYRIVTSIEQWISFIDSIESSTTDLLQSVQSAKSKILDLAIHGKLVPHDANDEPASELLKRINPKAVVSCDNPHYSNLPEGWVVCTIGEVANYINGKAFKPEDWRNQGLPIVRIQNLNDPTAIYNYSDEVHEKKYLVKNGDLLFAWAASLGTYIWRGDNAWLNQHIFKVEPRGVVSKEYLHIVLDAMIKSFYDVSHGSGMVHITRKVFENIQIAIPPYKEQQRIVSKVNDLFSQLDMIEKSLQA